MRYIYVCNPAFFFRTEPRETGQAKIPRDRDVGRGREGGREGGRGRGRGIALTWSTKSVHSEISKF